jgi:hypothetical protein
MKKLLLFVLMPLLVGCASGYRSLRPNSDYYPASRDYSGLEFSYKMGVLRERHNNKYAKREDKTAIRVVAVKLANNTGGSLVVGEDFKFYSGGSELVLLDPALVHTQLKQGVPIYLLYLLLSPMQLYTSDENGNVNSTPIGLFIGPGIAFGNMLGAGAANQNFLKELIQFNIINKTIEPGQTLHGIIGVRDNAYNPIEIRFTN